MAKKTYTATLLIWGRKFDSTGASVSEAISGLRPGNVKGKSVLTVSVGNQKRERVLSPFMTSRLFNTRGISQEVALKNTTILFDL